MNSFMNDDFLLETEEEKALFNEFARNMPICDYHCHLSPKEIYENKSYETITDLWLSGDHYKWRIMRNMGYSEKFITGDADKKERFILFATALQNAIGNPLYHWAHLELQRFFGINLPLNEKTAEEIYETANQKLKEGDFRPQSLIKRSGVRVICTTDDPTDSLEYHIKLRDNDFSCKVLPTFRPDKALDIEKTDFCDYIEKLSRVSGIKISSTNDVIKALRERLEYFISVGCRVSDQSFSVPPFTIKTDEELEEIFRKGLCNGELSFDECDAYKTKIFTALMKEYKEHNICAEIHIGAMRNNNTKMYDSIGVDTGFDIMNDKCVAEPLNKLLDRVNSICSLPKTVLFNLNSKDNLVLSASTGNFQSENGKAPVQFGPAWWFLDTLDGMTEQLKTLASTSVLGNFIGMETDSRSFTSYARHEYFRRILCHVIGSWVNKGMIAYDRDILGKIIKGICFENAMEYFEF